MRLVIDREGTRHEVRVAQVSEHATLADLIESATGLAVPADESWWVDGAQHAADARIGEITLLDGSQIARSRPVAAEPLRGWSVLLSGGLHAGPALPVPRSRPLVVGRSPQADIFVDSPSLSWTHVTFEREGDGVRVSDAGSTNGTYVDGVEVTDEGVLATEECVVVAGGSALTLTPDSRESLAPAPGTLHNLTPAGTAPFNRPPRPGRAGAPEDIRPPERKDPPAASRFSLATVVAPLVLAGVMVVMSGPQYALIALMSPVLAVGTWWEGKRRRKADVAEEKARFEKALKAFELDVAEAAAKARTRRREDVPDPAATLRRAALPTTRLWQRRAGATTSWPCTPAPVTSPGSPRWTERPARLEDEVKEAVDTARMQTAPVVADLTDAGVVGIVGPREGALALARSLLTQAAVHCGPGGPDRRGVLRPRPRRGGSGPRGCRTPAGRQQHRRAVDVGAPRTSVAMLRALKDGIDRSYPHPRCWSCWIPRCSRRAGTHRPARCSARAARCPGPMTPQQRPSRVAGIVICDLRGAVAGGLHLDHHGGYGRRGHGVPARGPDPRRGRRPGRPGPGGGPALRHAGCTFRGSGAERSRRLAALAGAAARAPRLRPPRSGHNPSPVAAPPPACPRRSAPARPAP